MSTAAHTPGPWEFKNSSGAGLGIWADVSKILSERYSHATDCPIYHISEEAPKVQIAYELWTQFPRAEWDEMQQANGRLMAAAPNLLTALELAIRVINNECDPDEYAHPIAEIKAAIEKATGAA